MYLLVSRTRDLNHIPWQADATEKQRATFQLKIKMFLNVRECSRPNCETQILFLGHTATFTLPTHTQASRGFPIALSALFLSDINKTKFFVKD